MLAALFAPAAPTKKVLVARNPSRQRLLLQDFVLSPAERVDDDDPAQRQGATQQRPRLRLLPEAGSSEKYGAWRNEIEKLACPRRAEMFERVRPARLTDGRRRDGKKDDRADS